MEYIAVVFNLLSTILGIRRRPATWSVGLVAVLLYAVIFLEQKLYAQVALQAVYALQCVAGYVAWRRGTANENTLKPQTMPTQEGVLFLTLGSALTLSVGWALARFTDGTLPYLDAGLAAASIIGNILLARRRIENWVLWAVVDAVYVALFVEKGLPASAASYVVFLVLAVVGWRTWQQAMARA